MGKSKVSVKKMTEGDIRWRLKALDEERAALLLELETKPDQKAIAQQFERDRATENAMLNLAHAQSTAGWDMLGATPSAVELAGLGQFREDAEENEGPQKGAFAIDD